MTKQHTAPFGAGRKALLLPFLALLLVAAFLMALSIGSSHIPLREVVRTLAGSGSQLHGNIILNLRLPRALIAVMVGCNLAVSGALLQAVMRNPLADPGLTGVSSGASIVAITIMLLFPALTPFVPVAAFVGACLTCFLIYSLAWKRGLSPVRIILAGVAVNSVLGGLISVLSILFSDRIQGVLLWTSGSIAGKHALHAASLFPYTLITLASALCAIKLANVLQLGDDMARNLGHNPNVARLALSAIAAFSAGVTVSVVGIIGFVGLVVPHFARMLVGSDYKALLPASAVMGALLVLLCDTLARTAFAPLELPVGVIMAALGGPFFLWLLRKKG